MSIGREFYKPNIERDQAFLLAYYGENSPTKGNLEQSALAIGLSESVATKQANRIFKRYDKKRFQEALTAVGVNNILMANRLRKMIEDGSDKDAINAIRLALAAKGEATDQQGASVNIQSSAPVMVIVGANASKINALRTASKQPTRRELELQAEAEELERCKTKLEMLKRGELPQLPSKSHARKHVEEAEILDIHPSDASAVREVADQAGGRDCGEGPGDAALLEPGESTGA